MGILETIDQLIQTFVAPLSQMGSLLALDVNMPTSIAPSGSMPLSSAALTGFVMPWVNGLGGILTSLANFLNAL